jgi:6-phosphogluconolactonase
MKEPEVVTFSAAEFSSAAANYIYSAIRRADRPLNVALAGGTTPQGVYKQLSHMLANGELTQRLSFFLGDERWVDPESDLSNFRMIRESLFSEIAQSDQYRLFPVDCRLSSAQLSAESYQLLLSKELAGSPPQFDLALLGLGADKHTASLFPGREAVNETKRSVVATLDGAGKVERISLTVPVFTHARELIYLVAGAGKREALQQVLKHNLPLQEAPASLWREAQGQVTFLVDQDAKASSF